ncbi:MAG: WXG100 family type VII secretion target [Actinomycetota bacterium]|nr:WXG100 family type VII secretion target [Actinomycetota bacterium]
MLKVTPEQLHAMSGSVNRTASDVAGSHQALKAQLGPLFGADWSGTAAAQFTALYDKFDANARGMNEALHGIGTLLNGAGTSYADAERHIASTFRA